MSFFSFSEQFTGTLFQAQDGSFWVGIKKALSKTLGAKDHGGGPNSAQRSMLLTAVQVSSKPCINTSTVTVNL